MKIHPIFSSAFFALTVSCFACNNQEAVHEADPASSSNIDTVRVAQTDTSKLYQQDSPKINDTRFKVKRK